MDDMNTNKIFLNFFGCFIELQIVVGNWQLEQVVQNAVGCSTE